jgi:serine/threonine-protein kinase
MNPERPPRLAGPCPLPEILAAYSVGKLPAGQTQVVAQHIAGCDSCIEALEHIGDDDTLVVALRRHVSGSPTTDEPVPPSSFAQAEVLRLGSYDLLEKIGEGAMGVVYRARQVSFNRPVALKMAQPGQLIPPEARVRLQTEGEAIARLDHPNIVRVYACGEQDGQPYFSMELIEGQTLAQKLDGRPMPEREAAELVRTLALAVDFAHQKDVIHRDLKPANVLIAVDGSVKLTDFGLAKLLDAEAGQTRKETILGTASYMAPEQARGDVAAVGPLADVYGLGAILYETLTGKPPFRAETGAETLRQVQSQEPIPPSRLRPRLSPCLEAICLKCLEKDPHCRYASAAALADDLERWLQGRPTSARPLGPFKRCWKAVRRRPVLAGGVLACVLTGVVAGVWWGLREPSPQRRYQQRVAPLLAQLQRGEAVDLIEPGGKAPAFMVRCGKGLIKSRMTADGFTVTTPGLGLVEFLPRLTVSQYRLHAELQHDRTRFGPVGDGGVGVIFSHRYAPSPDGEQHLIAAVALNDWDHRSRGGKLQSRAMLQMAWYLDTPTDGQSPFKHRMGYPPNQTAWYPSPAGPDGILHTLVIDVNPQGITAFLGDSPGQKMGPLQPRQVIKFFDRLRAREKEARDAELEPPNHPAIGVVVSGGQCTIRRLRVVPQSQAIQ